uniref:Probradykinin-1 n=1 Tax=Pithecopus azureus TaxID=2034991 RepID=BRK1_PITAZ|nr:RecName: Full=Probradykinin-1; Contains: RecName: Full=Glu,Pro-[Val1,Thr6]-bradykinyl-Leu,Thr; Contains: RecName: Full=[Val1,Thr6]-bradykinyl-Leu,Thr; AltName: Full=[Val1,Thr6]-bradykinin-Leu,Thr; Contains: RecName: Full=[Val1,Thr6]-bradykinin; Flags: Precursor [Pithecopus azureus]CAK55548.1 preprobradykinin-HA1 [Pithecopus azureus]
MSFLKKSLFLVLFLGLVSFSICEEEKRETEEEENKDETEEQSEEKKRFEPVPPGFTPFRLT